MCLFLLDEVECETLKTITKDEVLSLLMTHIHPSSRTRSKLSVHTYSQTVPSPRMSLAASAELLKHLKAAGIPVQEGPYNAAAAMQFSVAVNQTAWRDYFEKDMPEFNKKTAAQLIALMPKLVKMYPLEEAGSDAPVKLPEGTIFIEDIAEFKSTLPLGKAAHPVEIYSDFGSKL
jgi:insulysin